MNTILPEELLKNKIEYRERLEDFISRRKTLREYGRCLNLLALDDKLPKAFGREKEILEISKILLRRNKPNPLLVGEAGVGKTAVVEQLARYMTEDFIEKITRGEDTPYPTIIIDLPLGSIVAGTKYRGDFEERFRNVINEVMSASNGKIVLFIDEIHSILTCGTGSNEGLSAGNILKPVIARGDVAVIGATTTDEVSFIRQDKALMRRFSLVTVNEIVGNRAVTCLKNIIEDYENYFNILLDTDVNEEELYELVKNVSSERVFPDNIIDVIDESMAAAKYEGRDIVTMKDLKVALSRQTGMLII